MKQKLKNQRSKIKHEIDKVKQNNNNKNYYSWTMKFMRENESKKSMSSRVE